MARRPVGSVEGGGGGPQAGRRVGPVGGGAGAGWRASPTGRPEMGTGSAGRSGKR